MCDNNYFWQNNFYCQYMQQHAAMMQWIQNLHSFPTTPNASHVNMTHNAYNAPQYTTEYPKAVRYAPEPRACSSSHNSISVSSENYSTYESENYDDSEIKEQDEKEIDDDEDSESECEYEFNVDAIIAMRKAKEELKEMENKENSDSDSSSIAMIEKMEEYELVELGSMQDREARHSVLVGNNRDKSAKEKQEEQCFKSFYGKQYQAICGLETAMSVSYEHLCDTLQPPVWPVYPLRLKSCV